MNTPINLHVWIKIAGPAGGLGSHLFTFLEYIKVAWLAKSVF